VDSEDRLARFTEYTGGQDNTNGHERDERADGRAGTRWAGDDLDSATSSSTVRRERGHSMPPGANIDNIRDFYKVSDFELSPRAKN
jgi:hypothetical protein